MGTEEKVEATIDLSRTLTVLEVATLFSVSPATIRNWTDRGVFKRARRTLGGVGQRRYDPREVVEILHEFESGANLSPKSKRRVALRKREIEAG